MPTNIEEYVSELLRLEYIFKFIEKNIMIYLFGSEKIKLIFLKIKVKRNILILEE